MRTTAQKPRNRWLLPILCMLILLAAAGAWIYQRIWAFAVLEREMTAGALSCEAYGELLPAPFRDWEWLNELRPGTAISAITVQGPLLNARQLDSALRHLSGPHLLRFDQGPAAPQSFGEQGKLLLKTSTMAEEVEVLLLPESDLEDADMPLLARWRGLGRVDILQCGVTGETFPILAELDLLTLDSGQVTDRGLAGLAALPAIRFLTVSGEDISLEGVKKALETMSPTMQELYVYSDSLPHENDPAARELMTKASTKTFRLYIRSGSR